MTMISPDVDTLFTISGLATVTPIRPAASSLTGDVTIQERFDTFHAANPWVYTALEELTADLLAHGHKRVGLKMLFEVIRWQYARSTTSTDGWRVNNSLTSRYARLLIANHSEWETVFEIRRLQAA